MLVFFVIGEYESLFANGMKAFLKSMINVYTIAMLIVIYLLTYYSAGLAAKEIVFQKKNFVLVSIKYALFISLAITLTVLIIGLIQQKNYLSGELGPVIRNYLLPFFWKSAIPLVIVWLLSMNKLRALQSSVDEIHGL